MNPGDAIQTLSVGSYRAKTVITQGDISVYDTISGHYITIPNIIDSTTKNYLSLSYQYRLGVHEKYPFGKGLEIGIHFESSFCFYEERNPFDEEDEVTLNFYSDLPPLIEFDIRMGLKPMIFKKSIYNHNITIGWTIGTWVDNGWYLEYGCGWEYEKFIPYTSIRAEICATDLINSTKNLGNDDYFKYRDQTLMFRNVIGCAFRVGKIGNAGIIPDYIVPELSLCYPQFSKEQKIGFTYHLGFRWTNAF